MIAIRITQGFTLIFSMMVKLLLASHVHIYERGLIIKKNAMSQFLFAFVVIAIQIMLVLMFIKQIYIPTHLCLIDSQVICIYIREKGESVFYVFLIVVIKSLHLFVYFSLHIIFCY